MARIMRRRSEATPQVLDAGVQSPSSSQEPVATPSPLPKRSEAARIAVQKDQVPEAWGGAQPAPAKLLDLGQAEPGFARATGEGKLREQEWEQLAEMVHAVGDPALKLKELQRALQVNAEQTWRANPVVRAELANSAKALHIAAKLEVRRRELDRQQIEAAAKKAAREALQEEAERGARKGVISLAEVEARVALDYKDEYRSWEMQKTKDAGMVEFLEDFAKNLGATIRGQG